MTVSIRDWSAAGEGQPGVWLGTSEMARRIRALDWSATPLGPLAAWPRSLQSAVAICLHSQFQMAIYWGDALTCIYNDAERSVLGKLHPIALGMPAHDLLRDSWNVVGAQLHAVMERGEPTWAEDQSLSFNRRGVVETGYFTYSYSPILDDRSQIGGVLLVTQETTARVLAERRLEALADLSTQSLDAATPVEVCQRAIRAIDAQPELGFVMIYLIAEEGTRAVCVAHTGQRPDPGATQQSVQLSGSDAMAQLFGDLAANPQQSKLVDGDLIAAIGPGTSPPVRRTVAAPIRRGSADGVDGFLVAGIKPDFSFDRACRHFVEMVAIGLGRSVATARARKEERAARADPDGTLQARQLGADDYLVKPFGARELLTRVRATLHSTRIRSSDAEARGRAEERAVARDELRSLLNDLKAAQRRIAAAGDAERRRIERNLHDGAQQRLMAIRLELGLVSERLGLDSASARSELDRLRGQLDDALQELRELAHGLYPPLLASDGLPAALSAMARHAAIPVEVQANDFPRLPRAIESAAYFCCLEALQNVTKHAGDRARATVGLGLGEDALQFWVQDDGVGFDRNAVLEGYGLVNLRDRLEALGGEAAITSIPGRGTTVTGQIPLP